MLWTPRKPLLQTPWLWIPKPFHFAAPGGYPCCCGITCGGCSFNQEATAVFPGGWTNNECSDCPAVSSDTYVLQWDGVASCGWEYEGNTACGTIQVNAGFLDNNSDAVVPGGSHPFPWTLQLHIRYIKSGGVLQTWADFDKSIANCDAISGNLSLARYNDYASGMGRPCNLGMGTPATLDVG